MAAFQPDSTRCRFLPVGIAALALGGCAWTHTTTQTHECKTIKASVDPTLKAQPLHPVVLVEGLFIGVSNYEPSALVRSTPAHTVSAAIMAEIFTSFGKSAPRGTAGTPPAPLGDPPSLKPGIETLADLRMLATADDFKSVDQYLDLIPSARANRSPGFPIDAPGEEALFGTGKPVTKKRIREALQSAVQRATNRATGAKEPVLLVVYVAAHGWQGPDGRSYILPADTSPNDDRTWLAYEDVVQEVGRFNTARTILSRHALIIFDTCRNKPPLAGETPPASDPAVPAGMTVVESTSPGDYAWYRDLSIQTEGQRIVKSYDGLWESRKSSTIDESGKLRMSVLPEAMRTALLVAADDAAKDPGELVFPDGSRHPFVPQVRLESWLEYTKPIVAQRLQSVPAFVSYGGKQEVRVRFGNPRVDLPLFDIASSDEGSNK